MKCDKCGKELPGGAAVCPHCGAELSPIKPTAPTLEDTVRLQTVPQRPKTVYQDGKPDKQSKKSRAGRRAVRNVIVCVVVAALLVSAWYIIDDVLKSGDEDPVIVDLNTPAVIPPEDTSADSGEQNAQTPEPAPIYEIAGVWVLSSGEELTRDTLWSFGDDYSLTIYYFGAGEPENPFGEWPSTYAYDVSTGTLTIAGEDAVLTWNDEGSFSMNSPVLGACRATKTDAEHIPSGAADIREYSSGETAEKSDGDYIFPDSNTRYLTTEECEPLTDDELLYARNEIYARLGLKFSMGKLKDYFESKDWYVGETAQSVFDFSILNEYELANVYTIKGVEDAR